MRLIDADRLYNTIIDEIDPISISMDGGEMRGMMRTIIAAEPTIDAVPLEPLCEWLAERYEPPYALIDIDKLRIPIDFRQQKEIWMAALTKWMEEQDAAD